MDRHAAALSSVDLARVDVEAQHVVADFGEARAGDEPDVAGADHRDLSCEDLRACALICRKRRDAVGRLRDRTADHQVVGAALRAPTSGVTMRAWSSLRAAGEPDPRRDEREIRPERRAHRRRLRPPSTRRRRARNRASSAARRSTLASPRRGRCPSRAAPRRSRLVSTVTAISSGRVRPSRPRCCDRVARGLQHRAAAGSRARSASTRRAASPPRTPARRCSGCRGT